MAGCGFTPAAIDDMPFGDALAVLRYWRDHPPTNEILTAAHGMKGADTLPDDPSGIGELIRRHPNGRVTR